MDLFSSANDLKLTEPLAEQLRPKSLDDIVGQKHILGPDSKIGKRLRHGHLINLILWGPPGSGKTTFALVLAKHMQAHYISLNATEAGAKVLREIGNQSQQRRQHLHQRTLVFVDEIHRFNKSQQDVLLPFLEKGDLILIGATTENPSYELNPALLSRCHVLVFESLNKQDLIELIKKVENHYQQSLDQMIDEDAVNYVIENADGDGRRLIGMLESIYQYYQMENENKNENAEFGVSSQTSDQSEAQGQDQRQAPVQEPMRALLTAEDVLGLLQKAPLRYDKSSEMHYDLISAFIKSVRGSDPNAAVYYLARMLESGEDPVFIARRLIILASEDVGNADPRGLTLAVSGLQAVEAIGMPEARIVLSQVTTYLSSCPKSNASYKAIGKASEVVKKLKSLSVPLSLRSSKTELSKKLGYGNDYLYPHQYPQSYVKQTYLPDEIKNEIFYEPTQNGFEKNLKEYILRLKA